MQEHAQYTVKRTTRDAGAKHKSDGKYRQSHRLSDPIYVDDGIFRHPFVVLLRTACTADFTVLYLRSK
jgi:hypothetical protein